MADFMKIFMTIIIVQSFYAIGITTFTYAIPDEALNYVTSISDLSTEIDIESTTEQIQESLERQTNIPVVELGALVFYSGNILIDLVLNFAFAIPQMFDLLINGVIQLIPVDVVIFGNIRIFVYVVIMAMYFISVINLIVGVRSGRTVV